MNDHRAPAGRFRVVFEYLVDGTEQLKDFQSFNDAMMDVCHSKEGVARHVYNDQGAWCASWGPEGTGRGPPFKPCDFEQT